LAGSRNFCKYSLEWGNPRKIGRGYLNVKQQILTSATKRYIQASKLSKAPSAPFSHHRHLVILNYIHKLTHVPLHSLLLLVCLSRRLHFLISAYISLRNIDSCPLIKVASHECTRSVLRVNCTQLKEASKARRHHIHLRYSWIPHKVTPYLNRNVTYFSRAQTLDSVLYRTGLLAALRSKAKGSQIIGVMITASHNPAEVPNPLPRPLHIQTRF